jgi:CHAT domain-containing protein
VASAWGEAATSFLGPQATEERAKGLGPNTEIIHFACHGILDRSIPLNSALVLSVPEDTSRARENGLLQAWEVFEQVRIDASLVVLSACDTALGQDVRGEGMIGLTRAFQYAGARTVVASLWAVPDRSTAALMRRFHTSLSEGESTDQALRHAQIALLSGPIEEPAAGGTTDTMDASHPYAWSGFQVIGDWR